MHITIRNQLGILLLLIISVESCSYRSLSGGRSNNTKGTPLTNQKNNTDTSANSNEGANINTKNGAGDTQLHMAIGRDDEAAVNRLLQHPGIDINITDKDGKTPLQRAITKGNKKIIEKLLTNGANPNIKNNKGNTAPCI